MKAGLSWRIGTRTIPVDFLFFMGAVIMVAFSQSLVDAVFNNFLNETFRLTNLQRGTLELPRETPGFLVVFVSALFFFLAPRRLAALALLLQGAGIILIGLYSPAYAIMLAWLFIYSTGQHLFIPLNTTIGMEFASEGRLASRLGQIQGAMNLAAIVGSFTVFMGFRYLGFTFTAAYLAAGAGFVAGGLLIIMMRPDEKRTARETLTLRREYGLFYWLNILYGTRKQIFITFAPWVLVTVYRQPTATVATLLFTGGVIGIVFKPALGRAIDHFGERAILMTEAVVLVAVCLGYGFARFLFDEQTAFLVAAACYVTDQLLMSVSMARATYLRKIALRPEDVSPTLTMGVTIDHVFSIALALAGGIIWMNLGYQYIFLLGGAIAVVNGISASRIRVPSHHS